MDNNKLHVKSLSRECVFKAVFASRVSETDVDTNMEAVLQEGGYALADKAFTNNLLDKYRSHLDEVILQIKPLISLQASRSLNDVEYCILLVGAIELLYYLDTPPKVVINEYVNMSKKFGTDQGYKLVNAVLDQLYRSSQGVM